MAHLAEVEEAVSAVEGADSLPVEVCSSGAAAVVAQLTQEQDAVDLEELPRSAHLTRSTVRCALWWSLSMLLIAIRDGQIRARLRERDVLRIHQHQDPLLQRAHLPREQGRFHRAERMRPRD